MVIDILSLFPGLFSSPFDQSILRRAQNRSLVKINLHDLRKWAINEHGQVDDTPYGGGVGMVMRIEPIFSALKDIKMPYLNTKIVLMDARGTKYTQSKAKEYSLLDQLIIICGHYEGVDERVKEYLADESIRIGDYILTGGEIPAMVITDSVVRLIPGVLVKPEATALESFSTATSESGTAIKAYLEHPQYTKPEVFNDWKVPEVLLSGNHKEIANWRKIHSEGVMS